ncbi:unnamed protein product [Kuraishia capsulata CBS 1993]|uniref:Ammonium transporter AmtB-like domain-containing protein n=1 Tax=Kuraishia capsulata CBS 1993 TaxID=1382522 RepID=W6MPN3_9ASCO|nr:uncharacterized protein KUCA_T00003084001 [Kuraishia capsulata CBS 1993]CDK27107.1 unnamed protein product [Kuraishia capsulata CBS 1993]
MGYANSGFGSAMLLRKARDLSTLEDETSTLDHSDMGYVMFCTVGVFMITPAIGLFYGGALKRKNVLQMCFQSYMTTCIITIQWFLIGYTLACSTTSTSHVLGNFKLGALQNLGAAPLFEGGTIPSIVYFTFSVFFPVATVQIFVGAIAERARLLPSMVVGFIWTTVCYCPFAYATWASNGWLYQLGALDFAGGGPVHIASGVSSLAYSMYIGKRKQWKTEDGKDHKPYSPIAVFTGVTLIWGTWLCFNSGTLLAVNVRTGYIMANTQIAASFASFFFVMVDYIITKKFSIIAACEGAIVGLVNITPSCGFYSPYWAAITSAFVAICCRLLYPVNEWLAIDDTTHSFVVHGVGGILGSICLGVFASPYIAGLDGVTEIEGGWIFHHWKQMGYQFAAWTSTTIWSFVATYAICFIVDHIPGLKLRASEEAEMLGMDAYEMAEMADEYDIEEMFARFTRNGGSVYSNSNMEVIEAASSTKQNFEGSKSVSRTKVEDVV